jgi:rhamnulokinase
LARRICAAIQSCARKQGNRTRKGAIVRCALESLALEYRWVAEQIDQLTGRPSGHSYYRRRNPKQTAHQFAASAAGRTVIAGPVEATAVAISLSGGATGEFLRWLSRMVVKNSFNVETNEPLETVAWDEAYARYLKLKNI